MYERETSPSAGLEAGAQAWGEPRRKQECNKGFPWGSLPHAGFSQWELRYMRLSLQSPASGHTTGAEDVPDATLTLDAD